MKKYLITGLLCVLSTFAYSQEKDCPEVVVVTNEVRDRLESIINNATVESKVTNSHYALQVDFNTNDFIMFANASKEAGHKKDSDFDKWKKQNGKHTTYYMFYTTVDGKINLYHEALDAEMAERFQQYLPKGTYIFDEKQYNLYFGDIDFSKNHWKQGGDAHARLDDLQRLAVAVGKDLGITIDPNKITFRLFETQQIEGLPPTRMYIPTTSPRNDNVKGFAKWNDDVTSIEIDASRLKDASISDAIRTIVEEVYHKYQMSEVKKQESSQKEPEKARDWISSFNDNNRNNYGKQINDLQNKIKTETNTTNREKLQEQLDKAIHSYFQLKHEEDAKEYAGKVAAMEYFMRNIQKQNKP
jgi:hypothetical protein